MNQEMGIPSPVLMSLIRLPEVDAVAIDSYPPVGVFTSAPRISETSAGTMSIAYDRDQQIISQLRHRDNAPVPPNNPAQFIQQAQINKPSAIATWKPA